MPRLLLFALFACGCSSSESDYLYTGDGSTEAAVAKDGGAGGTKADASRGTGGGTAGSPGTGGTPTPIVYTDAVSPVPLASWVNITNNLSGMPSECGNAAALYANPFVDMLITGVARHGLFASNDGGATWTSLGTGGGSTILNRMTVILFDPETPGKWYESGIYGWESPWTEGVFETVDNGFSFLGYTFMGPKKQSSNDSISVDFTDPSRSTMLSGGHEQSSGGEGLFLSTSGGDYFDEIMNRLPSGLGYCTQTLVVTSQIMLVGCGNAIMRTTDQAATFTKVYDKGVRDQPLLASDGSIYWAAGGGGLLKSTDQGVTFSLVADASKAGGRPIELPDKRIAAVANKIIVVSADGGGTWTPATTAIPFDTNGIAYSAFRRAFYASHGDCSNNVPAGAYAVHGWDHTAN